MTRVGAERTEVEPLWPRALIPADTHLVYLDLNQWIALAKAASGHRDGERFRPAYETLRDRKDSWTYVIGLPLIMELSGILRRSQRRHIGEQIEFFTDYACVLPLNVIARLEFESALADLVPLRQRYAPIPLLGKGVMRAAGFIGGLKVRDQAGNDVTAEARLQAPGGSEYFDRVIADGELRLNRGLVWGPTDDEEEAELRADGWDPSVARSSSERRAKQEREQVARFDEEPRWRRGRARDVISARYLALEMREAREEACLRQGVQIDEVIQNPESARRFTDSMPAADVWITLMTAKHRNADSRWAPNDIFDVDALSVAAAYCDIVVMEKHSAHVLNQAGVPERLNTRILTDLDQLAEAAELEQTVATNGSRSKPMRVRNAD